LLCKKYFTLPVTFEAFQTIYNQMTAEDYQECVNLYADFLYRFILKHCKHQEDARDVVQNAFEILWNKKKDVEMKKSKSFLFKVAYWNMVDLHRKNNKTKSIKLLAYQTMLVPSASTSSTVEIKSKKLPLFTSIKNQLSATMDNEAIPIITQEVVASAPIKIGKQGREIIKLLGWAGNQLWGDEAYNPDIHIQTGFFEYQRTSANNKN